MWLLSVVAFLSFVFLPTPLPLTSSPPIPRVGMSCKTDRRFLVLSKKECDLVVSSGKKKRFLFSSRCARCFFLPPPLFPPLFLFSLSSRLKSRFLFLQHGVFFVGASSSSRPPHSASDASFASVCVVGQMVALPSALAPDGAPSLRGFSW